MPFTDQVTAESNVPVPCTTLENLKVSPSLSCPLPGVTVTDVICEVGGGGEPEFELPPQPIRTRRDTSMKINPAVDGSGITTCLAFAVLHGTLKWFSQKPKAEAVLLALE